METRRPTSPAAEEILGLYFPVLDHGFVALVDYMGSDEDVERAARVSYGYGTRRTSETRGLIRYLRRHRHTTPSEMVELKFHCAMPIFVARQWIRHRSACLAEGTEVYFDLPGCVRTTRKRIYKMRIEDVFQKLQPTRNETRPDKQKNPLFRADRVRGMKLRQLNEDTLALQHTELVNVFDNGVKPVFRMILADGKTIECTADHRFLFSDGWKTLRNATGLDGSTSVATWIPGDHFVYVNGSTTSLPALYRDRAWLDRQYKLTVAKLVKIERFEYVGEKRTYDLEVRGPYHNFVANGVVTHNSVNEYSGRYSLMPLLFYEPDVAQVQAQSAANRQGRAGESLADLYPEAVARWEAVRRLGAEQYEWLVGHDVARELARIDLPLSTYTQWYWKIDLHNLFHFLTVRADPHAQHEIRVFARVIAGMLKRVAPLSFEAWVDYEFRGAHLSRGELEAMRRLVGVADGGLEARPGRVSREELARLGLSKREIDELLAKLAASPADQDFDLDLSAARPAEHFAREMEAAVPRVDRK